MILQEDLNDPLNTIPENIEIDIDEPYDDAFDDDVYETVEEQIDSGIWLERNNKGRTKRAATESTTIDEASEILEKAVAVKQRTAKLISTGTGEAAPTLGANS
jgi:predicted Zn-dependent protease